MHFVRHGAWCSRCLRSCNSAGGALENGISAYDCDNVGQDQWRPKGAAWIKNRKSVLRSMTPWFLLEGDCTAGPGGDGEPLVHNFVVRYELAWDQLSDVFSRSNGASTTCKDHCLDDQGNCRCCTALEIARGDCDCEDELEDEEDVADADGEPPLDGQDSCGRSALTAEGLSAPASVAPRSPRPRA